MSKLAHWLRVAILGFALLFIAAPVPAYAAGVFDEACNGQTDSATCTSVTPPKGANPLTGADGILLKVARIIAIIAGVTAVIVIIISGFSYMTADGDPQKAKKARDALVGALVGLFIIAISSVIITFVINSSGV
jgi:heme/copper-type cytochrome/quinol oxidase subunit 2